MFGLLIDCRRNVLKTKRSTFLLFVELSLLSLSIFVNGQNVFYEEEGICDSIKCSCDCTTKTLACHRLIFEYLPIFPVWVENLQLDNNHLTLLRDYSFVNLTNLKRLFFSNNDLEYVYPNAFAGLSNLETLDLSNNRISHLIKETFNDLKHLVNLNLSTNHFGDLSLFGNLFDWRTNRTFVELNLGYNQFYHSDHLFHFPKTKKLSLRGSKFYAFTGEGVILAAKDDENLINKSVIIDVFDHLDELDIFDCEAELYPEFVERIRNVIRLNIGGNHVSSNVLAKLSSFHRLEFLDVNNVRSKLDNWNVFPAAIKELDVSNLKLTSINFANFPYVGDLETLKAAGNKFEDFVLSSTIFTLKHLDLSDNLLTTFPKSSKFLKFTRLEHMDLSKNRLTTISDVSLMSFPSLTTLILTGNQIRTVDSRAFSFTPNLRTLDVSYNKLTNLFSINLSQLRIFNVSNNVLIDFDGKFFENLPSLRLIDLSFNKDLFDTISCQEMSKTNTCNKNPDWFENIVFAKRLETIDASRTNMERLPNNIFNSFINLSNINFAENFINDTSWNDAVSNLQRIPCVKSINLSSNRISHLNNLTLFQNPCVDFIDVSRNPFTCDCKLLPLIEILKSSPYSERALYNESLYYCFSPKNNWRYPMYEFINTLQPCNVHPSFNALTLLLYIFVALVSTVFVAIFCRLCIVAVRKGVLHSQYIYRPLQLFTEDPTNLVQL